MLAASPSQPAVRIAVSPNVRTWVPWIGVGSCWLLVACSLAFPAFLVDWPKGTTTEYPSVGIFLFGWLGVLSVLDGKFDMIGWLANPCFFLTSVLLISRQYREAIVSGGLAIAFAAASLLLTSAMMNEAGHTAPVLGFAGGFYLWVTAIVAQTCLAFALALGNRDDAV